jgi:Ca2+-binding EF-hand superfamily protein
MLSPFLQRKIALAYYRWDQTKDGLVDGADFEQVGRRVADKLGLAQDSAEHSKILAAYRSVWDQYSKLYGTDSQGTLTLQDHLTAQEQFIQHPESAAAAESANAATFVALDLDGNGLIDLREWQAFLHAVGASDEESLAAFKHLDQNGDGSLSVEELAQAAYEYYSSDDPSAHGNFFFGAI